MRENNMRFRKFLRAVSSLVLVTFTSLCAQPTIAALQHEHRVKAQTKVAPAPTADERYAKLLTEIEEQSKKAKRNRSQAKPSKVQAQAIRALEANLTALEAEVDAGFAATERHLNDKNLAEVIKQRHRDAVATYRSKQAEFKALIRNLAVADDRDVDSERDAALAALTTFFDQHPQARKRAPLDPNSLPWRTPKKEVHAPITDPAGFRTAQFGLDFPKLAGTVPAGTALPKSLPPAPNAADLAETEDVQLTPAIRAKALELGNHPVTIHNFVRNNVRFTPTYGSVQGAQDTLDKLSGNAFDIASLLIALYRAAGIPARYAYGTIEVPANKVMNWVGGVSKIEAALQVPGQGGVPSVAVVSGGTVSAVRLEHVWVEAWVMYFPSRAAKHVTGQGDTWIPVDASFKQYTFAQGMNLQTAVPFDANTFVASAQQGATVNASEGWVQNLNQGNIQSSLASYQNQLKSYVDSQKPGATAGDVLGTQAVVPYNPAGLAGTLPYKMIAKGPIYADLPAGLRHQFQYRLYADAYERNIDNPTWTFQRSLPSLAGKRITLSFKPSSTADADLIASYLPQPHADGSPVELSELPSTLPAYVRVTPELRVEGEIVATGGTVMLGAELAGLGGFTQYDFSGWDLTPDDTLVAGQTTALGLSLQGVSNARLRALKSRMDETKAKLDARDTSGLTADQVSGDILTATIWSYFVSLQNHGDVSRGPANVIDAPGLSYGLFHAAARPNKLYGVVTTSARFTSVLMDVGHLRHLRISKGNDLASWINYNRMRGTFASAMEHAVPEAYFSDANFRSEGVSAAKAIDTAISQGQKIFTITAANKDLAFPQLAHSTDVLDQIQNATAAGKEVTISQSAVTVGSWTGAGYTIVDPDTGAGAYLLEGGANGGETSVCNSLMLTLQIIIITVIVLALIAGIAATLPVVAAGAAFLAQAGSIIATAIAGLPAAVKAAVGTSLMMLVSAQASAGQIFEMCSLVAQDDVFDKCIYLCPLRPAFHNYITRPKPRDRCYNIMNCAPNIIVPENSN